MKFGAMLELVKLRFFPGAKVFVAGMTIIPESFLPSGKHRDAFGCSVFSFFWFSPRNQLFWINFCLYKTQKFTYIMLDNLSKNGNNFNK